MAWLTGCGGFLPLPSIGTDILPMTIPGKDPMSKFTMQFLMLRVFSTSLYLNWGFGLPGLFSQCLSMTQMGRSSLLLAKNEVPGIENSDDWGM